MGDGELENDDGFVNTTVSWRVVLGRQSADFDA